MKNKFQTILLITFFASLIYAQDARKIEFQEFDLDNGLHVILHQDDSTPIVAVSVSYHVGSKNEVANRTGFAHFFEHLMFEGSKNIDRGEYFKIVQKNGGTLNANTSFDRTFYFEVLPSNQLELGLWLESERMLHLNIDSTGVETQRKVIKEERKQSYENRPYGSLIEQTFSHAFKVHPYKWIPIGSAQYIDLATIDEFRAFYKKFYVPNNATLSIAGDINPEQAKKWVNKYFAAIPAGSEKIARPTEVEPQKTAEVRDTVYDNIRLPLVVQAYHIPAQGTEDYYALNLLTTLLSGGQSSRIYKEVVDKKQKALQAGSFPLTLEDPGLFLTYAITNVGVSPDDVEAALNVELERVKTELVSESEFQKLRNQVENSFVSGNSTVMGIAESLADYYVYFGNTNLINTEIDRFMKVTREDIMRVANKYLTKENRVVLYYLPKSEPKS